MASVPSSELGIAFGWFWLGQERRGKGNRVARHEEKAETPEVSYLVQEN